MDGIRTLLKFKQLATYCEYTKNMEADDYCAIKDIHINFHKYNFQEYLFLCFNNREIEIFFILTPREMKMFSVLIFGQ